MNGFLPSSKAGYGIVDATNAASTTMADGTLGWDSFSRFTPYGPYGSRFSYGIKDFLEIGPQDQPSLWNVWIQHQACVIVCWIDWQYKLAYAAQSYWVVVDGSLHALDTQHMISGPRVYFKAQGMENVRMVFSIEGKPDVRVEAIFNLESANPTPQIMPWVRLWSVNYQLPHTYKALSYYDLDIRNPGNDRIFRVSDSFTYTTEIKVQNIAVRIGDYSYAFPRIRLLPDSAETPEEWLLRCCDTLSNPDLLLSGQSIYRVDVAVFYRGSATVPTSGRVIIGPRLYVEL